MVKIEYTDGSTEEFSNIIDAEKGILEMVAGCDFAVGVQDVVEFIPNESEPMPLYCTWKVHLSSFQ